MDVLKKLPEITELSIKDVVTAAHSIVEIEKEHETQDEMTDRFVKTFEPEE